MNEQDIALRRGHEWFRFRACGIIEQAGKVLMVANPRDNYLYSVGGAVQFNETTEEAVKREVLEETGWTLSIARLLVIHENYFTGTGTLEGLQGHELAFYYLMDVHEPLVISPTHHSQTLAGDMEHLVWIDPKTETKTYHPEFLRTFVGNWPHEILHLITKQNG